MADVQATPQEPKEAKMEEGEPKPEPEPEPEPQNPVALEALAFKQLPHDMMTEFVVEGWDFSFVKERWENHRSTMSIEDLFKCAEVAIDDELGGDEHPMVIDIYKYIFSKHYVWPMKYELATRINNWAMRVFNSALTDDEKASLQQPEKKEKWPKIDITAPDTTVVERQVKIGRDTQLTTLQTHVMISASEWFKALREQEETERNRDDDLAARCFAKNEDVTEVWNDMMDKLSSSLLIKLARQHPQRHPAVMKMEKMAHKRNLKGMILLLTFLFSKIVVFKKPSPNIFFIFQDTFCVLLRFRPHHHECKRHCCNCPASGPCTIHLSFTCTLCEGHHFRLKELPLNRPCVGCEYQRDEPFIELW